MLASLVSYSWTQSERDVEKIAYRSPSLAQGSFPAPSYFRAIRSPHNVTLLWDAPVNPSENVEYYSLERLYNDVTDRVFSNIAGGESSYSFSDGYLTPGNVYKYSIYAKYPTQNSETLTIEVTVIDVPGAPQNLEVVKGNRKITASWDSPAYTGFASIINYTLWLVDFEGTKTEANISATETKFVFENLKTDMPYQLLVFAVNEAGLGIPVIKEGIELTASSGGLQPISGEAVTIILSGLSGLGVFGLAFLWQSRTSKKQA